MRPQRHLEPEMIDVDIVAGWVEWEASRVARPDALPTRFHENAEGSTETSEMMQTPPRQRSQVTAWRYTIETQALKSQLKSMGKPCSAPEQTAVRVVSASFWR